MVREIVEYPSSILQKVSKEVVKFDKNLHDLLDDMYETMMAKSGIGLAAIQVGVPLRILILNLPSGEEDKQDIKDLIEAINPEILTSKGSVTYSEGCLSVPGVYEDITRKEFIKIKYYDRAGNKIIKECDNLMSIAFQHEIDHLNGHLFIEKLSYLKRKKFDKEWKRRLKSKKS